MSELVLRAEVAAHAERAAREWALNPKEPKPACPYAIGTDAAHAWEATLSRYLCLYSALTSDEENAA